MYPLNTLALGLAVVAVVDTASAATTRFAVIGDYGQSSNTQVVANRLLGSNPDFICTVGDNTYNTSATTANWDGAVGQYYAPYIQLPAGSAYAGSWM